MSSNNSCSYIGKIVSLISVPNIRYEGSILAIDNDKITLKNVRIFGTEDRECDVFIDMQKETRPMITFYRSGIRSINIIPQYTFYDPSIVDQAPETPAQPEKTAAQREHDFYRNNGRKPASMVDVPEEPITNDFDFEESNKKLEKEDMPENNSAPAYKKDDFFDSLQDHTEVNVVGHRYRNDNLETFGKKSLEERKREYRNNHRYQRNNQNNRDQRGQGWNRRNGYNRKPFNINQPANRDNNPTNQEPM